MDKENDLKVCYLKILRDKMPLNEINYENTVIYKIQHIEKDELLYVGHTTDFTKRKYLHKVTCNDSKKKHYSLKVYEMIRNNGGWDSFKMLEVKKYPCTDRREAAAEEDRIMKELKATMNSRGAVLDVIKAKKTRELYKENKKEAISLKEREYRESHRVQYANHHKNYYALHKEEIKANQNELVRCECGQFMRKIERGKTRHQQSQKHKDGILAQQ
jgi:hypothetical protein